MGPDIAAVLDIAAQADVHHLVVPWRSVSFLLSSSVQNFP